MPDSSSPDLRRRHFCTARWPRASRSGIYPGKPRADGGAGRGARRAGGDSQPNAFVRIGTDNTVTVLVKHLEMGQGIYTGLPTLVADELDAAWSQVRVEGAPADATLYNNLFVGPDAGHRRLDGDGQLVRAVPRRPAPPRARCSSRAAAKRWNVPADSIAGEERRRAHARERQEGDLRRARRRRAAAAGAAEVKLKDPKDFVYIGKHVPRTDSSAKSQRHRAASRRTCKLPDMLTAVVAHPPRFGGKRREVRRRRGEGSPRRALRRRGAQRRRRRRRRRSGPRRRAATR